MIYEYYSKVGGWRFVVLFHQGRKIAKLLDTATFEVYTVKPRDVETLKPYDAVSPSAMAKRIKERRKIKKDGGVGYSAKSVRLTLEKLGDRAQCLL